MQITYDANGQQVIVPEPVQYFSIEFQPYTLKELLYQMLKSAICTSENRA